MDMTIRAAGEGQWQLEPAASVPKFLGSLVHINSVAVDVSGATKDIKSPVHGHFSIRGYVAGVRRKDWKKCLPFVIHSDTTNSDNVGHLPPLSVPSFRWWQCSNCISDDPVPPGKGNKELFVATKNDIDMPHDAPLGSDDASRELLCKRKRKLRSIADIMVEERKSNSDDPSTYSPSSSGAQPIISVEAEPLLSQLECNNPSEAVKDSTTPRKKRKIALKEDRGLSIGTSNPKGSNKRSKGQKTDEISERESAGGRPYVLSGKRISFLESSERPSSVEGARGDSMPPCKNQSVANFDDEETRRYIPDLNEAFPLEQVVGTREKQFEWGKNISGVASDDIPMEIVELLAKNQHERALGNSEKQETRTCSSRFPPLFTDETLPFPSREEVRFSSSPPCEQRKVQFSSSEKPRINGGTELFWPPRGHHFDLGLTPKNRSLQQNSNTGVDFNFSGKYGRGKPLSNGKEMKRKKPLRDGTKGSRRRRSLDSYSSDTIPALQLLSLMNQGINASGSLGPENNNLGKTMSPKRKETPAISQRKQSKKFPGGGITKKASSRSQGGVSLELKNTSTICSKGPENLVIHGAGNSIIPPLSVCTLNRNPAEFSVPDARNKYTISARNLKPTKSKGFKDQTRKREGP